ncbi:MAG: 50S ribosomal protein L30 [Candidatus Thermoplasmatota archaeon]|jgi:large subunit ribosomal protein L30|nr:50S ribosomal protein L30 [Candidatus Thermoplasmatota archaeon]MCL5962986.1 50S ribosomal protein L30 [Candidatus Thermoplasmatota archaeon]
MVYAVIRVKGTIHSVPKVRVTFELLRLTRCNHAVIIPENSYYKGMLQVVKDYVTWGEVSEEALLSMLKNYGRIEGNKQLTDEYLTSNTEYKTIEDLAKNIINGKLLLKTIPGMKPMFRLHPPVKGYRSVKRIVKKGGALGYRGKKINELILKMSLPLDRGDVDAK